MEFKNLAIGAAIGAVVVGAVKYLTEPVPMTAADWDKIKFDPLKHTGEHPFYYEWAKIPRNLSSVKTMSEKFNSAILQTVAKKTYEELSPKEMTMIKIACLPEFLEQCIILDSDNVEDIMNLPMDMETNPDGTAVMEITHSGKTYTNLNQAQKEEYNESKRQVTKNKKIIGESTRLLGKRLMELMLTSSRSAELTARIVGGDTKDVKDLTEEEIMDMWDGVDLHLHHLLEAETKIMEHVVRHYVTTHL